jgi:hypothetical protein
MKRFPLSPLTPYPLVNGALVLEAWPSGGTGAVAPGAGFFSGTQKNKNKRPNLHKSPSSCV